MLKTSRSAESLIRLGNDEVEIGSDSRARHGNSKLNGSRIGDDEVNDEVDDEVEKKSQNPTKSKNLSKSKKMEWGFLTSGARMAFTKLRQAFIKASIFHHFNPEHHIRIGMDASGYSIGRVFSQLTLDNLSRWYSVTFFSQKIILAKTRYETHNSEFLAIVEAFKTWKHYLEGSQHKVLILTNHKNLRWFINTKSLSSRQVR